MIMVTADGGIKVRSVMLESTEFMDLFYQE